MHSDIDGDCDGEEENTEWSITDDNTLEVTRANNQCKSLSRSPRSRSGLQSGRVVSHVSPGAMELVSPILQSENLRWRVELQAMFENVDKYCSVESNRSCGTHIHISPGVGKNWSIEDLRKIGCAILHFEGGWNIVIPSARQRNRYAQSNRFDNTNFADMTDAQCLEAINTCRYPVIFADLMNNNGDRCFGWNFINLYFGGKMTVEFRRAPGVQDFETCEAWVALVIAFVEAARQAETTADVVGYASDVEGLRAFIYERLRKEDQIEGTDDLFDGKTGTIQNTSNQ